jgi:diguanylate cyclase (GGDEF)-like protein
MHTLKNIFFVAIFLLILSCEKNSNQHGEATIYKSFRDIPGITASEIEAIEALQAKKSSFVYGMLLNIESFNTQNGEIKGYAALLCDFLTELFGMSFKPAIYKWDDLIPGLANGSIDFTGELTANAERRKTYYMTDAIAERIVKSFRLKDAASISQIKISRLPRYGFLDGSVISNIVSSHSYDKFESFLLPSHNAVHDALISGQIDAFIDENAVEAIFDAYDDMVSIDFLPLIYNSVSLSTQKAELAPIISVVQKMLNSGYASHLPEMYKQGQLEYTKSKLERYFSDEELEYIRRNPVVSFAAEFDNYPTSFYNNYENQWQGIAFDVLKEMEKLTGLSFEIANDPYTEWPELLKMLEYGTVSMVSELIKTKDRAGYFLWSEIVLMRDKCALISKVEHPYIGTNEILHKKVGLIKGTAYAELFKIWFASHPNTTEFENVSGAFQALESKQIDLVMTSQNTLLAITNYMEQPGYKINILFDRSFESSFGFNKNEYILRSIVDKTLKQIDVEKIYEKWKRKTFDYRVKLAKSYALWFACSSFLLFCIIILLFILYKKNRTEGKRLENLVQKRTMELHEQRKLLEHLSLTDQLTKLPNRRNFDIRLELEWRTAMRKKQQVSILMLDIDYFKDFNDKYGHLQGDEALCIIAKIIERMLKRSSDFAARWGGEEFAILLPDTDADGALRLAESIRENVEKANIPLADGAIAKLTISIGINTHIPEQGSSLEAFISVSDEELYKAKETGRNRVCAASS